MTTLDTERDTGRYWKGRTEELEKAVKERDGRLDELRDKQKRIQQKLDLLPPGLLEVLAAEEQARRRSINRKDRGGFAR